MCDCLYDLNLIGANKNRKSFLINDVESCRSVHKSQSYQYQSSRIINNIDFSLGSHEPLRKFMTAKWCLCPCGKRSFEAGYGEVTSQALRSSFSV